MAFLTLKCNLSSSKAHHKPAAALQIAETNKASRRSQPQTSTSPNTSRAKRGVQPQTPPSPSSSNGHSIKLTMKVAPSKLREVMRANEVDSLKDTLGGGTVLDGPRSSRARSGVPSSSQASPPTSEKRTGGRNAGRPKYHEVAESDDDAEGEDDVDVGMNDFDEIGAEAEGGTDEEDDEEDESEEEEDDDNDVDMEDSPAPVLPVKKNVMPPKAPKITLKTPARDTHGKQPAKPEVVVTPAQVGPVQSVEDEEMEEDDDDEELDDSELPDDDNNELSDAEVEDELDDTNINQEDVEGVTNLNEEDEEEDDDDDLSDDESGLASGTATPDPAKLTARQRRHGGEELMSLDMAPQQRKFFTDAEKAMKKDEHARKRKELTKRKIHEEKTAALNRLVSWQCCAVFSLC